MTINSNVYTFSTGSPLGYTGAPYEFTCSDGIGCHNGQVYESGIMVTVTDEYGNEVSEYEASTLYTIQIETTSSSSSCYGFQTLILGDISTDSEGTIIPGPGDMEYGVSGFREYLRHTAPSIDGIWTYTWMSSSNPDQDISIYTSVNAANCNGLSSGDSIYTNLTKLSRVITDCDIEWDLVSAQPGILFFDCEFSNPDTPRLELGIANFSGGSGNYFLSCGSCEFSHNPAEAGDTVYLWFNQQELDDSLVTIYVNDETSMCAGYDSVNIALAGFPIDAICSNYEDPCEFDVSFNGDSSGQLDIDDFYCEDGNLVLAGTIDGPTEGYYLDFFDGNPGWMSTPGSFDLTITAEMLNDVDNLGLDIDLGQFGNTCVSYDLGQLLVNISLDEYCNTCNVSFDNELDLDTDVTCFDDGSEYRLVFNLLNFDGVSPLYNLSLSSGSLSVSTVGTQPEIFETEVMLTQADIDAGDVILTIESMDAEVCLEVPILTPLLDAYPDGIDVAEICDAGTGIGELSQEVIAVYPNPAIAGSEIIIENHPFADAEIIEVKGSIIDRGPIENNVYQLSPHLSDGIYFIKVKSASGTQTAQIKVKR